MASCSHDLLPLLAFEGRSLAHLIPGAEEVLVRAGIFTSAAMRAPARALDEQERAALNRAVEALEGAGVPGVWTS